MKKIKYIFLMLIIIIACEDKEENDSTPPSILITNIQANATLSSIASIKVDASDNDKIEIVEFMVDGIAELTLQGAESSIYTFNWNTDVLPNGKYSIYAKAIDKSGNEANSSIINVNVINYRNLNVFNNTPGFIGYRIDNQEFVYMDPFAQAVAKFPKETDFNFYATTGFPCGMRLFWDLDLNENEDTELELYIGDSFFYLITENKSGEVIDKIVVNDSNCDDDIQDQAFSFAYYNNIPDSNRIEWHNKFDKYYYVDDQSDYPLILYPWNESEPTKNLSTYFEIGPYSEFKNNIKEEHIIKISNMTFNKNFNFKRRANGHGTKGSYKILE